MCDVISLKVEVTNNLKLRMFTRIIYTIIGTAYHINLSALTFLKSTELAKS